MIMIIKEMPCIEVTKHLARTELN